MGLNIIKEGPNYTEVRFTIMMVKKLYNPESLVTSQNN